ncbi:hypothetical protein DCC35_16525 [Mangrovivirga cuniculi]|uniref:Uncharacterized protein n=1 Tax=Mangrovivirga cuniculi TaxID=2715131 RepID=A0A4D7JKV7_9BACT|nr:hypothetical protein DCC35_16525 [Mangrovivirga cuniculi]
MISLDSQVKKHTAKALSTLRKAASCLGFIPQRAQRKQQAVIFYHREHRVHRGNIKMFELSNTESAGFKENY